MTKDEIIETLLRFATCYENDCRTEADQIRICESLIKQLKIPIGNAKPKCEHNWMVKGESSFVYQTSGRPMTEFYCTKCLATKDL